MQQHSNLLALWIAGYNNGYNTKLLLYGAAACISHDIIKDHHSGQLQGISMSLHQEVKTGNRKAGLSHCRIT